MYMFKIISSLCMNLQNWHTVYTDLNRVILNLLLLNTTCPVLANSVDPDKLASSETNWSASALFVIKYVNSIKNPDQVIWLAGT